MMDTFFRLFPILASDYFYFLVIAMGFWMGSRNDLFKSLGFLIPCSTIVNDLLKNSFQIPRPDASLYLVPISSHNPFGFPSGDAQVGTVFCAMLYLHTHHPIRRLMPCIILGIAVSRVYLGVHSISDVLAGASIGLITVIVWQKQIGRSILNHPTHYWILVGIITVGVAMIPHPHGWSPHVSVSIGSLMGLGLSLSKLEYDRSVPIGAWQIIAGLLLLIAIYLGIPILKTTVVLMHCNLIVKYMILSMMIFLVIPHIVFHHKSISNTS